MDFKRIIKERGLKLTWVAKQIGVNENSFRVYLMKESKMPVDVEDKLKVFLS